jgi:hypothetical protein
MAKRLASFLLALCIAVAPGVANACSVVVDGDPPTRAERRAEAAKTVAQASAIYDGVVVEPATRDRPAKVQVTRVFKGPVVEFFYVQEFDSCDIFFDTLGERTRFVLFRGPEIYSTWVDTSTAEEIDWVLKSDRRKEWPYYRGNP